MSRRKYQTNADARALPKHAPVQEVVVEVAAPAPCLQPKDEAEAEILSLTERIKAEIASPVSRMVGVSSPVSLYTIAAFLAEFCREIPNVQVTMPPNDLTAARISRHDLCFCIGLGLHHAITHTDRLEVSTATTENSVEILLDAGIPARTDEDALDCFGLDAERLLILKKISADADFSFRVVAGDRATLVFSLRRATATVLRLSANSDASLLAAFLLPLTCFTR